MNPESLDKTLSPAAVAVPAKTAHYSVHGAVAVLTLGGPGGDIVFGGPGIMGYSALLLIILGAGPAALVLRRRP